MASKRVLVVDDSEIAADGLARLLACLGWNATCAYSAAGARESLINDVDVILLDIGMPDMDGYEFIQVLRNDMGLTIPVVALTGYGLEEDKSKALAAGFSAHLTKPIGTKELQELLPALLA